jgi:hypothetical protein
MIMKKLSVSFVLLLTGILAFAQQNVIKVGLGSAFSSNLNIKYERAFAEKHSIQVALLADFNQKYDNDRFNDGRIGSFLDVIVDEPFSATLGGFAIVPEYRYYLSKKGSPRGFYLGAYGKYRQRNLNVESNFGTNYGVKGRGVLWNVGAGIGMGAQFIISDAFVIDWYIGGLGYSRYFANLNIAPQNDEDFENLQADLLVEIDETTYNDVEFLWEALSEDDFNEVKSLFTDAVENTEIREFNTTRFPFGLIDLRTGISLGYAF